MKKLVTAALAATLAVGCAMPAFAETHVTELKANIQSTYTVSIPAATTLTEGKVETELSALKVNGNLAPGAKVKVTAAKSDFVRTGSWGDRFAFELLSNGRPFTEATWSENDARNGKSVDLTVQVPKTTWDDAKAGEYTASITFTVTMQ